MLSILSIFDGYMSSIFTIKEVLLSISTKSLTKSLFCVKENEITLLKVCLLYTSPSPRDGHQSRMPSSA